MPCSDCKKWLKQKKNTYEDGSETTTFTSPADKGKCLELGIDTTPSFGCAAYEFSDWDHVERTQKRGAPWQHWAMIPCPDCRGNGSSGQACHRCAGTGLVRKYDDGYIGEERTRTHPKEIELKVAAVPKCKKCESPVEIDWVACPRCGHRLTPPAEMEVVESNQLGVA
jgi:DNA-directed RNA polymerase subunit RPC12/RpoP